MSSISLTCVFRHSLKRQAVKLCFASLAIATVYISIPSAISQELPIVRSAALDPGIDVPWSQPVRIIDPFEGEYVGIFDKNFFYRRILNTNARIQVVSLWRNDSVRFLLAYSDRDCNFGHGWFDHRISRDCLTANAALGIANLYIKVGDRVFQLEGDNSRFRVKPDLASALKNSPSENIGIRLVTESGEIVDSEIGKSTVAAWKEIY
ncbi:MULTISPECIES: hypothetical protein [Chroococcidiopsis]|uniref:Uncharacterized protein n=1 Tax=Chroococcidiopsis thermalis (strain PCC 7203) TaxID=251229 RepID=K9U6F3_CHRTP|nr:MULTISPECIES: hypothetical protein [Chroococcidiopsis]AFY90687.1 hypothetical protein Chro_5320 [Chroococcidiopsis thermalis PCC 7203]PSB43192.1 hypothetical protein C7B80_24990 [Cyanosarcina cf. burmensis CCALA 770]URD50205.1 hypothetical protein M5J74_28385 [Chroococcidiopsis sp. CCNUC1]